MNIRAFPTSLGSMSLSSSQFADFLPYFPLNSQVSGDFVSKPWMATISMSVLISGSRGWTRRRGDCGLRADSRLESCSGSSDLNRWERYEAIAIATTKQNSAQVVMTPIMHYVGGHKCPGVNFVMVRGIQHFVRSAERRLREYVLRYGVN